MFKIEGRAVTDVGRTRDHNEDSYLCNNKVGLYAVADGMGGHLGGERASSLAVEVFEREVTRGISLGVTITEETLPTLPDTPVRTSPDATNIEYALSNALNEATRTIWQEAQIKPQYAGMGTTLSAVLFHAHGASICHVGDSRVYRLRDGQAEQLTDDHSWIAEQIRAGVISPEEAITSRFRNIITRSVGFEPRVEPDLGTVDVQIDDIFVLCSDGMSNYIETDTLGELVNTTDFCDLAQVLVEAANQRGGEDNITVVTIRAT